MKFARAGSCQNAIFITLEEEGGIANIVLWARQFAAMRRAVMVARLILVEGVLQVSREGVIHIMASHIIDRTETLVHLSGICSTERRFLLSMRSLTRFIRAEPCASRNSRIVIRVMCACCRGHGTFVEPVLFDLAIGDRL